MSLILGTIGNGSSVVRNAIDAHRRSPAGDIFSQAGQAIKSPGWISDNALREGDGVFEQKIRALATALEHEHLEQRESARSTLRGFIDRIVIPPGDWLQVVGNLGEMLTAAGAPREATAVVKLVAGAATCHWRRWQHDAHSSSK